MNYKFTISVFALIFTIQLTAASQNRVRVKLIKDLICFWDFNEKEGEARLSKAGYPYRLREGHGQIKRVKDGLFGKYSAFIKEGQWFYIPRDQCPALNIKGKEKQVSVVAWVKRSGKSTNECEAIAGMWNETNKKRQYCLFLNLSIWASSQQVGGHISGTGGPTEGFKYCMDVSIGKEQVPFNQWQCVAFTYDGSEACSYLNGDFEKRDGRNPYEYNLGIFDGGNDGADFTVGAVYRSNSMGNFFSGQIGGLAIFSRALSSKELLYLAENIQN